MRLTGGLHYEAPIDLVFARMVEPEFQPKYLTSISRIFDVRGRPDQVGSSFRFLDRMAGRDVEGRVEVVAVDAPRTQDTVTTYTNGMRVRWQFSLTPTADGGTDGSDIIDYTLPPGLLYRVFHWLFLRRLIVSRLSAGGRRFKQLIEAEAAPRSQPEGAVARQR